MSSSILRSARVISILTLASRVAGLVRDMAFSYTFGVGSVQSAFALAFQIPNLFRRLFGEGALSAAAIPVLTETLHHRDGSEMNQVVGRLVGLLLAILTTLCILAEIVVAGIYLYYRTDANSALTLELTALMMPFMVMICIGAILGGIENVFGQFALPASMPIVINLFQIAAALAAPYLLPGDARDQIFIAAASVLVGGAAQVWLQWRAVWRCGVHFHLSLDWRHSAIRRIAVTMIPMVVGLGVVQVNVLADSLIAWWFVIEPPVPGRPEERPGTAILYLAQHLYQFPLGVFLVALATAIFPALSRHAAEDDLPGLRETLARGTRVALFISIPCIVGMILVREPMVRVLFARGAFVKIPNADQRVALALAMYVSALWAYGLNHLVTRAFYALHDAKTPLYVAVGAVILNITLNLILVQTPLREAGLALATAIGAVVQFAIMVVLLRKRISRMGWRRTIPSVARTAIASTVMVLAVLVVDRFALPGASDLTRLVAMITSGGLAFLLAVWALRCEELHDITRR